MHTKTAERAALFTVHENVFFAVIKIRLVNRFTIISIGMFYFSTTRCSCSKVLHVILEVVYLCI